MASTYPGPSPAACTWTYPYAPNVGMPISLDTYDYKDASGLVWHVGGLFYKDPYGDWQNFEIFFELQDTIPQPFMPPGGSQQVMYVISDLVTQFGSMQGVLNAFQPQATQRLQAFVPAQAQSYIAVAQGAADRQAFAEAVYGVKPGPDNLSWLPK